MCESVKENHDACVKNYSEWRGYVGLITEDAFDCIDDMKRVVMLLTSMSDNSCACSDILISKYLLSGLFNMMQRDIFAICDGVKLSGGIFSEADAARGGILR